MVIRKRKRYKWCVLTIDNRAAEYGENPYSTTIVSSVSVLGAKLMYRRYYRKDTKILSVYPYIPC